MFLARTQTQTIPIKGLNKIRDKIKKKAKQKFETQILDNIRRGAVDVVHQATGRGFVDSDIVGSLLGANAGEGENDLQAEMGLSSSFAESAIASLKRIIMSHPVGVKAYPTRETQNNINYSVKVFWVGESLFEQLKNSEHASYVSYRRKKGRKGFVKSGVTISWLKWSLEDVGEEVLSDEYGIAYGNFGNTSRSGRAIMKEDIDENHKNITGYGDFPYTVSMRFEPPPDKLNWIHAAITTREVRSEIRQGIRGVVAGAIK